MIIRLSISETIRIGLLSMLRSVLPQIAGGTVCILIALIMFAAPVRAQAVPSQASVRIMQTGQLQNTGNLDFGIVIPGATGGRITVAPSGAVTSNGTLQRSGQTRAASFVLQRRIFVDYPVYLTPRTNDTITLVNRQNPARTLTLTRFTNDFARRGAFGLPAYYFATNFEFNVGGSLDIPADQAGGIYEGTFVVTIDFP